MIQIGEYQTLRIARDMPQGIYLEDEDNNEVLMPRAFVTEDMQIDDSIEVFVYCDALDREMATTEQPYIVVDSFAVLTVKDVNEIGAFCDWGVSKELFIPYANQIEKMQAGKSYVVYMYLDKVSSRLVGTTRFKGILETESDADVEVGQEVDLIVYHETNIGYKVVVNECYMGLVYKSEVHEPLAYGQQLTGYLKPIREDGKIDVSLYPIGHKSIEPNADKILELIKTRNGFLPFTDKSDPEKIRTTFGISKKLFKKAIGALYKRKIIEIKDDGLYLVKKENVQN